MASLAILLVLLAFATLAVAVGVFASSALLERYWWRRVASHLDGRLRKVGLRWDRRDAWRGCWRGRTIAARLYPTDTGVGLRFYVQVPTGSLTVRPRRGLARWWSRARPVGEGRFDDGFVVTGSEVDRGYLTAAVRQLLVPLGGSLQIQGGWLTWDEVRPVRTSTGDLEERLRRLVRLSDVLWAVDRDPLDRIEQAVLADPDPGVRRRALLALQRQAPRQAERLALRALGDGDPEVRWAAARIARAVRPLVQLCLNPELPLTLRRAAGAELLTLPTSSRHMVAARSLSLDPEPAMQRLAARLALQAGSAGAPLLLSLLQRGHSSVWGFAARGLARWGGLESARPLRHQLQRAPAGWARVELWLAWRAVAGRWASRAGALAVSDSAAGELALVSRVS